jgi:aspartate carbamoyltransferase catalytic subunit
MVLFPFCPKDDIKDYLNSRGVEWEESSNLLEVASQCDVIYQTRIQKERFGERIDLYEAARGKYIIDKKVLDVLPTHAVIMHPLPRLDEVRSYPYEWNNFHSIHYAVNVPNEI